MQNSFKNTVELTKNSFKDEGDGIVTFPNGLVITDDNIQRNGTRYDIESLDITKYAGQLTADHEDKLRNILGRVEGVKKNEHTVTINTIVYAVKQNPYARLAYDLLVGGFSKAFSTETIGPSFDPSDNTHYSHELVGLSQVVTPNNYSAIINTVRNSLNRAKEDGLDVSELQNQFLTEEEKNMEEIEKTTPVVETTPEVAQEEAPKVVEEVTEVKNEISDEQVVELFEKLDEISTLLKDKEDDEDPVEDAPEEEMVEDEEEPALNEIEQKKENTMTKDEINSLIQESLNAFVSNSAKAPEFTEGKKEVTNFKNLSANELFGKQINAAIDAETIGSVESRQTLHQINQHNLDGLKKAGIVRNSMTLASMGNFVISPEQYEQIVGTRTDYSALLDATNWREIESLEYVYAVRNGDIDMKNVALCDDGADKNLKPISEYGSNLKKEAMEQISAVTPVCDNTTRFFVANLMEDIAAGYRNDYDRKRAQLVIAKLEEATLANKKDLAFTATESADVLTSLLDASATLVEQGGSFIFTYKTLAQIKKHALKAGANGPLAEIFITGDIPRIFGIPYIVVPNDLMPALESEETVTIPVNGKGVSITHAIFYADLKEFIGFTNEGLQFEVATGVAYETTAGTVKSGFSRGETVIRGSMFRGGAFRDITKATGILRKGLTKAA